MCLYRIANIKFQYGSQTLAIADLHEQLGHNMLPVPASMDLVRKVVAMHAQNTLFAGTRKGDIVGNLGTAGCTVDETPPSVVPKILADDLFRVRI